MSEELELMDEYVNEDVDNANGDEDNEKDLLLDDEAGAFLEKLQQKASRVKKWGRVETSEFILMLQEHDCLWDPTKALSLLS